MQESWSQNYFLEDYARNKLIQQRIQYLCRMDFSGITTFAPVPTITCAREDRATAPPESSGSQLSTARVQPNVSNAINSNTPKHCSSQVALTENTVEPCETTNESTSIDATDSSRPSPTRVEAEVEPTSEPTTTSTTTITSLTEQENLPRADNKDQVYMLEACAFALQSSSSHSALPERSYQHSNSSRML